MVLDARLEGKSFFEQNNNEILLSTDQVILRCSAIFGCDLPHTDHFANILSEQIISFIMKFGYSELTVNEVILAMEINLPQCFTLGINYDIEQVLFSGRTVNVNFLAAILKNYKIVRHYFDRKIQNHLDGYKS